MDWTGVLVALLAVATAALLPVLLWPRPGRGSTVPGPWTLPLIGDTLPLLKNPAKYTARRHLQYGPVFRANLVGIPNLHVICDPAVARSLLRSDPQEARTFAPGAAFAKLFGDANAFMGYLNITDRHRYFRKCMTSALSPQALLPALDAVVTRHVEAWASTGEVVLTHAVKALALDVGVGVLSGLDISREKLPVFIAKCDVFCAGVFDPLAINLPGTALNKALKARDELKAMLWDIIADQAKECATKYRKLEDDTDAVQDVNGPKHLNLLEAQLKSAAPWYKIDADLAVQRALGNVLAAFETTRHMFLALMLLVASSPRVKAKLVEEQQQFLASHGSDLSLDTINAMPYLDATIKEAMRLLPATIIIFRDLVKPLQVGDHILPAGTACTMNTHLFHSLDPAVLNGAALQLNANGMPPHMDYETNLEGAFQPERWLEHSTRPKNYATFGMGTHLCIGMQVAYTEAKLLIAHLLRSCEVELVDKDVLKKMATMFPGPTPAVGTDRLRIWRRTLKPV